MSRRRGRIWAWALTAALIAAAVSPAAALSSGSSASRPPNAMAVIPFPGTPDAAPSTEIIFPGSQPSQVAGLAVQGSRSGVHTGQVVVLPAQRGSAFIPARRFTEGEHVTVRLGSNIVSAFTVAEPDPYGASGGSAAPTTTSGQEQQFSSRPDLHPPRIAVSTRDRDPDSGDIFLDVQHGRQVGPMILNPQGGLVWFSPLHGGNGAFDFRVQSYQGQPVLTYWEGQQSGTHGGGRDVVLNRAYHTVAIVHAAEGYTADLHEFVITPENTALITSYTREYADLRSVHGSRHGQVLDCLVQEIDIATGSLLWEWHALGHVPLNASYAGRPYRGQAYDYFHLNSVQQVPDGDVLISSRNTWAVYLISHATGQIIWRLGGRRSSFKLARGAHFAWQHDAQLQPGGDLTLFDNESSPTEGKQSRALTLALNMHTMRASLVRTYTHTPPLLAASQGDVQALPDGNMFVGWGQQPDFSEYSRDGRQIFSASFPLPVVSYRAFRYPWSGQPADPPALAVKRGAGNRLSVSASWNGATGVASWELLGGPSPTALKPVVTVPARGFETVIAARTNAAYVAVRALARAAKTLGTSSVTATGH